MATSTQKNEKECHQSNRTQFPFYNYYLNVVLKDKMASEQESFRMDVEYPCLGSNRLLQGLLNFPGLNHDSRNGTLQLSLTSEPTSVRLCKTQLHCCPIFVIVEKNDSKAKLKGLRVQNLNVCAPMSTLTPPPLVARARHDHLRHGPRHCRPRLLSKG
jgi:hypothetical protein